MRPAELNPQDPIVRSAVFGQQVQDFLKGEIGDFLIKKAEARLAWLLGKLKVADPDNPYAIAKLQAEIDHLERFEAWLGTAVQEGLTAIAIIDGEDDA